MFAKDLTFGMEIEGFTPDTLRLPRFGHSDRPTVDFLPSFNGDGWRIASDGSIENRPAGYNAVEFNSPVFKGFEGFASLVDAVNTLQDLGFKSNRSCGIHVHVGVAGMTAFEITQITRWFTRYELAFFAINGASYQDRLSSRFCQPSTRWVPGSDTRYRSLNTCNVGREKNTVEFRLFASDCQSDFCGIAALMATSLVARATSTTTIPLATRLEIGPAMTRFVADHWSQAKWDEYTLWASAEGDTDPVQARLNLINWYTELARPVREYVAEATQAITSADQEAYPTRDDITPDEREGIVREYIAEVRNTP